MSFARITLRTTDVDAARAFYTAVLGDVDGLMFAALPEAARLRRAPAHWLGALQVSDVDGATAQMLALGAERLGPPTSRVLRDPWGAVVELTSELPSPSSRVAWHLLHTRDRAAAWALYASIAGLRAEALVLHEGVLHQGFASTAESARGSIAETASLPGVHAHWLYFFRVASLDAALAQVLALGGTTARIHVRANRDRLASCEDAQGAAFGLYEAAHTDLAHASS